MQVNGQPFVHTPGLTLHALLRELGVPPERVAVALNDDFYPGARVPDRELRPGDVIEVVRVVAGG
ncbi:sulfur carrier protein ThiS [Deinococcus hopiensis]|uniref:Sulfur carrier protein n=1 Tax=Deinococcus hopiensis KR-140 TaxID=695939 RepID=A0A1W1UGQ6_9DEIO|nr:sulfur carrier protein ThiS [Deinococcus hopiensis]SMB79954.1 sulfur carrier protein [Deinococcus hopiensis KR-140]